MVFVFNLTVVNGNIYLNTSFNGDASDLLHDIRRCVQIDQTLVNAHFETVPCVGTFSKFFTLRLVSVMRMRWTTASSGAAPASFLNVAMVIFFYRFRLGQSEKLDTTNC